MPHRCFHRLDFRSSQTVWSPCVLLGHGLASICMPPDTGISLLLSAGPSPCWTTLDVSVLTSSIHFLLWYSLLGLTYPFQFIFNSRSGSLTSTKLGMMSCLCGDLEIGFYRWSLAPVTADGLLCSAPTNGTSWGCQGIWGDLGTLGSGNLLPEPGHQRDKIATALLCWSLGGRSASSGHRSSSTNWGLRVPGHFFPRWRSWTLSIESRAAGIANAGGESWWQQREILLQPCPSGSKDLNKTKEGRKYYF